MQPDKKSPPPPPYRTQNKMAFQFCLQSSALNTCHYCIPFCGQKSTFSNHVWILIVSVTDGGDGGILPKYPLT